jgi:prepilin-type N-terminal cleavage/methylation domain-containing protein
MCVQKQMKNNNGFTLIELIIVILIMSLFAIGTITGYRLLFNGNAKQASKEIINTLDLVQMENMTKNSVYSMTITQNSEREFYLNIICDGTTISSEALKLQNGNVTYETSDDETITITGSDKLEIIFRKDTGGVKENSSNQIITRIGVKGSGKTEFIRLITATGKHFIE